METTTTVKETAPASAPVRVSHRLRNRFAAFFAVLAGLLMVPGAAFATTTDPSGIDVKGTVFDPLKSEFVTIIIPAAAALLVAGIVWRMIRKNGKKAASDA